MKLSLKEIAKIIDATIVGDSSKEIIGINTLASADFNQISYAVSSKYKELLANSNAGAVILDESLKDNCNSNMLVVKNVYLAYSILTHKFKYFQNLSHLRMGSEAFNSFSDVDISLNCIIGKNVSIGENSSIAANCVIEDNVSIGKNSRIESNVTIQKGSQIGKNCIISPGAIIGSEGFGNARDINNKWHTIAHLGNVIIGDNVSIGANTTIDRGSIDNTEIHSGVKIDNLVHIAHNVISYC